MTKAVRGGIASPPARPSHTHTQKNSSTFDREMWAVVLAVCEFKDYAGMSTVSIITDHCPLLGLRHMAIDRPYWTENSVDVGVEPV